MIIANDEVNESKMIIIGIKPNRGLNDSTRTGLGSTPTVVKSSYSKYFILQFKVEDFIQIDSGLLNCRNLKVGSHGKTCCMTGVMQCLSPCKPPTYVAWHLSCNIC